MINDNKELLTTQHLAAHAEHRAFSMDGAGVHEQEDGQLFFAFLLLLYLCYKEINKKRTCVAKNGWSGECA